MHIRKLYTMIILLAWTIGMLAISDGNSSIGMINTDFIAEEVSSPENSRITYYNGISGTGASLKTSLHNLLRSTHSNPYSYAALWTQLQYTDEDPNNSNNIIQIYTGWSIPKSFYGGSVTQWNREHTWSKSHGDFGETAPAGTDLHHMRPCDATVNSAKGNKDFDNGGTLYTDASPYPGYSGNTGNYTSTYTWEPRDEDKGDVARMIFYMAVRYEGTDTSYNLEVVDYTNSSGPNYGKLSTLLSWHLSDPPDAREMQRNERSYQRQGNRNPFIDMPQYAQYIWAPIPANATNVSQNAFTISWTTPISATKYYLQVATDSLFTSFVPSYSNYDAALSTSKTISALTPGTTYYYRLRSYFVSGYSMYSPTGSVTLPMAAALSISAANLDEGNLHQAIVTLDLSNVSFSDPQLTVGNFSLLSAPLGLSISSVSYVNSSRAIVHLAFDGRDFDTNINSFRITVNAAEISISTNLTSNSIPIIAFVETPLSIDISDDVLSLNINVVAAASSYRIFAADAPDGNFVDISASGSFVIGYPNHWQKNGVTDQKRFYKAVGIRG